MKILLKDDHFTEEVEVRELRAGVFELLETPLALAEMGGGLGDIVRLQLDQDGCHEVLEFMERPFRHFSLLIPGEYGSSRAIFDFGEWIEAHGGRWETIMGGMLLLHFPRGRRMPKVKGELRAHLDRFERSEERIQLLKAGPLPELRRRSVDRDREPDRDQ